MKETAEILTRLARQRWTILTITLLAAAGAALFAARTRPVYEARALILVGGGENDVGLPGEPAPDGASTRLTNVLETLRSRAVAEAAAGRLLERTYVDSTRRRPLEILADGGPGGLAPAAEVVRRLEKDVELSPIRNSDIIRVVAHSTDRLEAPLIVSAYLEALSERRRELSLERIGAADVAVLDPPAPPDEPVSHGTLITVLAGLAAGFVLGVAAALLRITIDRRLYSPRDVARRGFTLAAAIRRVHWIREDSKKQSGLLEDGRWYDTSLIPLFHPFDPATGSFRTLLTAVMRGVKSPRPKRVMVTSANPGEGKTMVVANLAVTAARLQRRVLLIDADLRRPTLHRLFNIVPAPGLSDYIRGTNRFDEVVRISVLENLDVICCGTAVENSGRILTSWRLKDFLEKLAPAYDLFLFDTPSLPAAPDAATLGPSMDATLVVASAGLTRADQLQRAVERLRAAGAPAPEVVLNNCDARLDTGTSTLHNYSLSSRLD